MLPGALPFSLDPPAHEGAWANCGANRRYISAHLGSCDRYGFRAGAPTRSSKCASSECPPWAPLEQSSRLAHCGNKPCIIRLIMVPLCLARMTSTASSLEPSSASDAGTCASICLDLRHLLELNAAPCLITVCRLSSAAEVLCDHFNGKPHVSTNRRLRRRMLFAISSRTTQSRFRSRPCKHCRRSCPSAVALRFRAHWYWQAYRRSGVTKHVDMGVVSPVGRQVRPDQLYGVRIVNFDSLIPRQGITESK
jgi:hypothetical protein